MALMFIFCLLCSMPSPVASFPRSTAFSVVHRPQSSAFSLASASSIVDDSNSSRRQFNEDTNVAAVSAVPMDTPARSSLPTHLRLEAIPGKGLGVITNVPIPCHTVVGDYVGEVISTPVKDRRYLPSQEHLQDMVDKEWKASRLARGQTITGDYLYAVTMPGGADPLYMDAEDEYRSLWTRFINHASPPANNLTPKSIHESYDGKPRVWFVANRDIAANEELCFDYGDDYWLPGDHVVC